MKKILNIAILSMVLVTQMTVCQKYVEMIQSLTSMMESEAFTKDLHNLIKKHVKKTPISAPGKQEATFILTLFHEMLSLNFELFDAQRREHSQALDAAYNTYREKRAELDSKITQAIEAGQDTTELGNQSTLLLTQYQSELQALPKGSELQKIEEIGTKLGHELLPFSEAYVTVFAEEWKAAKFFADFARVLVDTTQEALPKAPER